MELKRVGTHHITDTSRAPAEQTEDPGLKCFLAITEFPHVAEQIDQYLGEAGSLLLSVDTAQTPEASPSQPEEQVEIGNRSDVPVLSQLEFDKETRQFQKALQDVERLLLAVFGPDASVRFEEDWNGDYERLESIIQMRVPFDKTDLTLEDLFQRYQDFIQRYVAEIPAETRSRFVLEPHPVER